jgi:hypothetical protein
MWKSSNLIHVFKKCLRGEGKLILAQLDLAFLMNFAKNTPMNYSNGIIPID